MNKKNNLIDKIDLDGLINEYRVGNVDAFETYLTQIWRDLSSRSDAKCNGINKMTFEKYYELPGMISERLFSLFDIDKNNYLDCNEFLKGMTTLFTGDFDALITFIFNFYDFDRDNHITKEDVRIVFSYVPIKSKKSFARLKFEKESFGDRIESQEELHTKLNEIFKNKTNLNQSEFKSIIENINSDLFLYILIFLLQKRPFNAETIKLLETIKKTPQMKPKSPSQLIASPNLNSKFEPSNTIQKSPQYKSTNLGAEFNRSNQAKEFLRATAGKIKEKPTLAYELKLPSSNIEPSEKNISDSQKIPTRKALRQLQYLDAVAIPKKYQGNDDMPLEFARPFDNSKTEVNINQEEVISSEDEKNNQLIEGYLYKFQHKKMKKIYFKLICKDMYFYKTKEDEKHSGMHNLSGVYIKEEPSVSFNGKTYLCFNIVFPMKSRKYHCENLQEYNQWLDSIRKAVGYANLNDIYEIKDFLGKGKFGLVRLGIHKTTQRKVAIKIVSKKSMSLVDLEQIKTEIEILKIAQHPNIIRLYDVFENEEYIYIIMEYCSGGDLFSYIEKRSFKIPECTVAAIIHKLCTAVFYLHEYGIIHRDLKPENILVTDNSDNPDIRLLDFGLGKIMGPGEFTTDPFGTLSYVAPEVLLTNPYNNKSDLWAIGIIAYLMLAGFLPFDDDSSDKEIARQTINDSPPYPSMIWKNISIEAKMFINNLLNKNPEKRMNIREVLEHQWLQKYSGKQETIIQRKKSQELPGGQTFKIYSNTDTIKKQTNE